MYKLPLSFIAIVNIKNKNRLIGSLITLFRVFTQWGQHVRSHFVTERPTFIRSRFPRFMALLYTEIGPVSLVFVNASKFGKIFKNFLLVEFFNR